MPLINVRTRGTRATMTVACDSASTEPHRVIANISGEMEFSAAHNPDHDAVMRALGAAPHPCQTATQAYHAAITIYRAVIGQADAPDLYANRNHQIRSRTPCPTCPRFGAGDISHIHSPAHQAHLHETEHQAVRTLLRWMVRNSPHHEFINARVQPNIPAALAEEYRVTIYATSSQLFITPAYLKAAVLFIPDDLNIHERSAALRTLRTEGATVQWITRLATALTPATRRRLRSEPVSLPSLVGARNIAPEKVARYINAGIKSNFYTYAKVEARPDDILNIYRSTRQRHTLADDLREGVTIPDALARIR